jgi:glyoxylase-like metal-dependent hydrolase (beta-lactamase superfamily II)
MELIAGIHVIGGSFPNNIYLIVDRELFLVDTSLPGNCAKVIRYLKTFGLKRESMKAIVITHSHLDHIGSARAISRATGAQVWAHHLDAACIGGRKPAGGYKSFRDAYIDGSARLVRTEVHRGLREGDMIECLGGFKVIHTPGHTPGSICLYQAEKGILFSGDTIQYSFGRIRRPLRAFCHDCHELDASLEKIAGLDFEYMFPSDGVPLIGGASKKVREFLRRTKEKH